MFPNYENFKSKTFIFIDDASAIIGLQGAIKFNGGGNINHSIFWQNLCPEKDSGEPEGALLEAINRYCVKPNLSEIFLRLCFQFQIPRLSQLITIF